jgi:predicted anti-sigma-YlaC factor YlaD
MGGMVTRHINEILPIVLNTVHLPFPLKSASTPRPLKAARVTNMRVLRVVMSDTLVV